MTLEHVSAKQWVGQQLTELTSENLNLRVINQQLWCCCGNAGILVFDSELQQQQQQHTIPAAKMGYVFNAAEMSNGDVVIAADDGLYLISDGKLTKLNVFCFK